MDVTNLHHPRMLRSLLISSRVLVLSPNGHTIATTSRNEARLWDHPSPPRSPQAIAQLAGKPSSLTFSGDSRLLATTGIDSTRLLHVTDPHHPEELATIPAGAGIGATLGQLVAFSPDNLTLIIIDNDHVAQIWDISNLRRPTETATSPRPNCEPGRGADLPC